MSLPAILCFHNFMMIPLHPHFSSNSPHGQAAKSNHKVFY